MGLHRKEVSESLSLIERRLWKRLWWRLFVRDRQSALAMGRPVMINLEDSDIPLLTEEDFCKDEPGDPSPYPVNRAQALYFIHIVSLLDLAGTATKSTSQETNRSDLAMASWMNDIPPDLKYSVSDKKNHDFYNAILHIYYYASLLMIHRCDRSVRPSSSSATGYSIPCQAALTIAGIVHNLVVFEEVIQCPPYLPYCIFWAMIVLLRQIKSPSTRIAPISKSGFETCMVAMSQISSTWEFGLRIFKLFEQFLDERRKSEDRESGIENSRPDC
jgi:hypothetical protein